MTALLQLLASAAWIGSLVCFVLMVIEMFRHGHTGLAIVCIVLAWFCGIGVLIAFIFGWSKVHEWNLQNLMTWWTTFIAVGLLASAFGGAWRFVTAPLRAVVL
jgi:hypothetical protein